MNLKRCFQPRIWLGLVILFMNLSACSQNPSGLDFVNEVNSIEAYNALKGLPPNPKYGQVSSLKVIWDLKEDEIYFINANKYDWHYDFVKRELGYWQTRSVFLEQNYSNSSRRQFVLANLNHYEASGNWTLEFSPADEISSKQITPFFKKVQENVVDIAEPALFLNTQRLEDLYGGIEAPFPVITPGEIYAGLVYQPLNEGGAYGYLRKIRVSELGKKYPGIRDIVVLNGTPLDISPTAGVITSEFQTPLSHINILCQNRGTPIMAQKGIFDHPMVDSLEWELVYFEVTMDSFILRKAKLEDARMYWEMQKPTRYIKLKRDLETKEMIPATKLNPSKVDVAGGKAANFGSLAKLSRRSKAGFKVPEGGFAIPFYWYQHHMDESGAQTMVNDLLANPTLRNNPMALDSQLKTIRQHIKLHPVEAELLSRIKTQSDLTPAYRRLRFRSSTNAEDIDGFNGAGLYTSKTGWVSDTATVKTVQKALQKVWASVWNLRAFQEREYFGIPQEKVAMGILVHRSFPTESANGVAITKNLYRKHYFGFVINVQEGETSVVSPPEGVICDQLICYADAKVKFYAERSIVEYLSHSSLTDGKPVLKEAQVVHLTKQLAKIKDHYFYSVRGIKKPSRYQDFGLDVEFKIDGPEDQLYIKQVRVFND